MIKYLSRRILLLTALYVCILFGIFALQFTNGNAFSLSIGAMMVTGTIETDNSKPPRPLLPLHISANGLDFFLDEQNPLKAYTADNTAVLLSVTSINQEKDRFTINFTENVNITFTSEKRADADIITISAGIPLKYQKVVFPYKLTRSARVEQKDTLTLISTGKKQFLFTGISVQSGAGNMVRSLPLLASAPLVYYQTYIPAKGMLVDDLLSLPGASETAYSTVVEKFASNARASFKDSVSSGALSEPLIAAYIAEMGRIGMYRSAVESIPETWKNGSGRTYLTNTFLANLEKTYSGLMVKERDERSDISRKLMENNPSVFEYSCLVPSLVDRGSFILLKDISRLGSVLDISTLSARQAAGILEAMMDFGIYAPGEANSLLSLSDACERKIKASLVRIHNDLYISDDGKTVNTLESLQMAPILIRYGTTFGEKAGWRAVGRLLVSSMVSFAGEKAVIPARFTLAGGEGIDKKTGIVAKPEQIISASVLYPVLVSGNTWYPHELSLSTQAGPGVWAWTSAQSVTITKIAEGQMKITTRFPQGETHYMVLRGIKPFYRIVIYGIDFRTDARFETYNSSGYVYNEQTETLYLKMRHKAEYEDILLYSGADPNAAHPSANPTAEAPATTP